MVVDPNESKSMGILSCVVTAVSGVLLIVGIGLYMPFLPAIGAKGVPEQPEVEKEDDEKAIPLEYMDTQKRHYVDLE